ncbi:tautomerase family protein, partial [Kocuria rosea]
GQIIAEDTGLGLTRTDDLVIVQVVQQGRSEAQKQAMYRALADRLHARTGLDPQDLIVSVTENTREDWSFGEGVAQFLEGRL